MNDRLIIIEECMKEIHKANIEKYNKPMIVTVRELSDKIEYNFVAKAYDMIYGVFLEDLETSEIVRTLSLHNMTYSYKGEVRNSSSIPLFGTDIEKII